MAVVTVNPFVLTDVTLKIAADNYESSASRVEFTPSSSVQVWKGLKRTATYVSTTTATWTCTLDYAQDYAQADSLSRYLFDHEGEEVEVEFEPVSGGPGITATIIVTPGAIGGAVDNWATASVSLGVKGKPALDPVA